MAQVDDLDLTLLADHLRAIARRGLASQQQIAEATGISQSTISKALNKRLKRCTSDLQLLFDYAATLLSKRELSPAVKGAAHGFIVAGGSEDELVAAITLSTRLVRGRRSPLPPQSDVDLR